ncbi:MAG TPA: spore germination protein [Symbiobacteriaceae bacterium]|nr:spore germination protein [Symbiobacteriaceae bacterium]
MWRWLERWFPPEPAPAGGPASAPERPEGEALPRDLNAAEALLRQMLPGAPDVIFRPVVTAGGERCLLLFIQQLADPERLEKEVLKTLQDAKLSASHLPGAVPELVRRLGETILPSADIRPAETVDAVVHALAGGKAALLLDGVPGAALLNYRHFPARDPSEPTTEPVIRGPKEGFTEDIRVGRALLRRRIRSADLRLESLHVGRYTQSEVLIAYVSSVVLPGLVDEVRRRLERIQIDDVLESGYLEELIEDHPFSPFSQVQNTERPDVVAAALLEGRVAILLDGTPSALMVPCTFFHLLQSSEDYYERFLIMSAIRLLRYALLLIALVLPSLYIATTTFHPEMIPTSLLITVAAAREGIPFPAVVEAILMELAFEALREAGIRLPQPVGQAVSIVGALVVGEAAVQAGIVSAPMVIVVAITGIASFTAPRYNAAIALRLLRFPLMLAAATLGLFGVAAGITVLALHLASLRSFGIAYFTPIMPFTLSDLKDVLFRAPHWAMRLRPRLIGRRNLVRLARGQRPGPPAR